MPEHFVRELGLSLEEFLRVLPAAVGARRYQVEQREISIEYAQGRIEILLHPTRERKLGALAIPATPVEFRFLGLTEPQRRRFLARFDRHFRRGGG